MRHLLAFLLISAFLAVLAMPCLMGGEGETHYIFVPDEQSNFEDPCRVTIKADGTVTCQKMFFGCVREYGTGLKLVDGVIAFTHQDGSRTQLKKEGNVLKGTYKLDGKEVEAVYKDNPEWLEKFNKAPPVPVTRKQAIATLDIILSDKDKETLKAMKSDELIRLHHGFGTGLRNGFGLWAKDSPIVKEYGGGHPDDVSMKLIEEYWSHLQKP